MSLLSLSKMFTLLVKHPAIQNFLSGLIASNQLYCPHPPVTLTSTQPDFPPPPPTTLTGIQVNQVMISIGRKYLM